MQDQFYVLYSPTEAAALTDATPGEHGAGFWSAEDGWSSFDKATRYAAGLREILPFPKSLGDDAGWVLVDSILFLALAKRYSEDPQLSEQLDRLADRYADEVIGGHPERFNSVEIQGVRNEHSPRDAGGGIVELDNVDPQFYSVYLHYKPEEECGSDCVGDFATYEGAVEYANELAEENGWAILDLVTEDGRTPRWEPSHSVPRVLPVRGRHDLSVQI
ncbi:MULTISPECIES: hypothetical protein [Cupriavidus]|uniref:Uncharacterized protein n=2 Tax=Cupriavidus TaxID=106589 RepID=A0A3G8GV65_9BURK|nr:MULTISPECIES: hypothetical protein [Cupriavidus]AZG12117.1 hypothetical protein EHF44_01180 [Cupriavidus pauculus]QBP14368.1 hypothetical protein DDF84_032080 [Cupriavidus metallidurans]